MNAKQILIIRNEAKSYAMNTNGKDPANENFLDRSEL